MSGSSNTAMPTTAIVKWRFVVVVFGACGICAATIFLLCLQEQNQATAMKPLRNVESFNSGRSRSDMGTFLKELVEDPDGLQTKSKSTTLNELKTKLHQSKTDTLKQNIISTDVFDEKSINAKSSKNAKSSTENLACDIQVKHIAFIKVHKAGSTTLMNVLQRFSYVRGLLIALPRAGNILNPQMTDHVQAPGKFDMVINHVHQYHRDRYVKLLPTDSKYIGIVRDPLEVTMSAFEYYRELYHIYKSVKGENKLMTYLKHREMYEPKNAGLSYTNNRMSFDFGMRQDDFHNPERISKFLEKLDSEMDLVLVAERFTESIVLLKRKFCWQMKDILYITKNKSKTKREITFTTEELAYHRNFSLADNMLYDYFQQRFLDQLAEFDLTVFRTEVHYFKSLLVQVRSYCQQVERNNFTSGAIPLLIIGQNDFNDRFNVTVEDCRLMLYLELDFCEISRSKQRQILQKRT